MGLKMMFFVFGLVGLMMIGGKGEDDDNKHKEYSAIYNFGDSNSDTGTFSAAFAMVFPPNGQNFPGKFPTRNCDGRLIIDFISEELKMPYLSAYLDSIGSNFSYGANFAAGGSSIQKTGFSPINFGLQISQFIQFKSRTMALYNETSHTRVDASFKSRLPKSINFSNALYIIDIGQNDLSFGFMSSDIKSLRSTIPNILSQFSLGLQVNFVRSLTSTKDKTNLEYINGYIPLFTNQFCRIKLGLKSRFFWIHNTGPIGCLARKNMMNEVTYEELDSAGCRKNENEIADEFNKQLKDIVFELRRNLTNAIFIYVDVYSAKYELIKNARNQGFVNPKKLCCGSRSVRYFDCGRKKIKNGEEEYYKCKDASKYISWDGVHYSEAANKWLSTLILNGSFSHPSLPIGMLASQSLKQTLGH
ncbi:GDSL esterase/lipase At3g27950-like [Vigna radiata var. radiata]|uniref:GDSL esterase/lipase At3g27950-like n=1 Tax=Vigna radiata var. radiata TaxID=3916 RepID=A0A3Q0FDD4_VIGRR|nr:GDSL esterase/lipase At3g27950-like [Vigna radiata var. radiata]